MLTKYWWMYLISSTVYHYFGGQKPYRALWKRQKISWNSVLYNKIPKKNENVMLVVVFRWKDRKSFLVFMLCVLLEHPITQRNATMCVHYAIHVHCLQTMIAPLIEYLSNGNEFRFWIPWTDHEMVKKRKKKRILWIWQTSQAVAKMMKRMGLHRLQVGKSDQFTQKWMNRSAGCLLMFYFSLSVIHCAKCRCAVKKKRREVVDDDYGDGESRNTSTHNQKEIYLLCLYDLSRTCTPNHNMFKEMKAPNEHNECENRYIKRVEWDSFTKYLSYHKEKTKKTNMRVYVFFYSSFSWSFFFINIKSIDWSIRYDLLSRKCWCVRKKRRSIKTDRSGIFATVWSHRCDGSFWSEVGACVCVCVCCSLVLHWKQHVYLNLYRDIGIS